MTLRNWAFAAAVALAPIASFAVPFAASAQAPAVPATAPALDADAAALLDRMGAVLRGLGRFQVRSDATLERVYDNGQKLQFLVRTTYLVDKPNRMMVDLQSDNGHRRIFYDGKAITMVGLKAKK